MGAHFAPARFSLVRISARDLVADGKSLVRNSGVGGGGPNRILIIFYFFDFRVILLSGPDPLRFLRIALRIEILTRCVFCVAGRIFIGFVSLPNLVLKLNLNMPKRLRVEAAYRSKTLAYCGSNPRFETSGPANSSTKMAY